MAKKTKRQLKNQARIQRRKNFLPTLILSLLFWGSWFYLVINLPPENNLIITGFFLSLFVAVFLTLSLLLANSRRGLLLSAALIGFLLLRFYRLANALNLILLAGIIVSLEFYFRQH